MILTNALRNLVKPTWTRPDLMTGGLYVTASGQSVSPESAKRIATVYRCATTIADDVGKLPLQQFVRRQGQIQRVLPDAFRRNMAYLVEVQPNRIQVPLIFKHTAMMWLMFWGNTYIWMPPSRSRELIILPSILVEPYIATDGQLRYKLTLGSRTDDLPAVEVLHMMINAKDGLNGRGILAYARDTIGRKQAQNETQDKVNAQGLMPGAMAHFEGEMSKEARAKVRESYSEAISGSGNAGRLLVLDGKVKSFQTIPISAADVQFLETSQATDVEIANFFKFPLYKLNMGKEAYNSNEQQKMDYLDTTLDPYLVQWEQAAQITWLSSEEQSYSYWRFNRDALLRTDAKTRSEVVKNRVLAGLMELNEGREIEDQSALPGGDVRLVPSNMAVLDRSGKITPIAGNGSGTNSGAQL